MDIKLVVVRAFGRHARGDAIDDAREVAEVLQGAHAASVVRVYAPGVAPVAPAASAAKEG
jgi:hypothetical protein